MRTSFSPSHISLCQAGLSCGKPQDCRPQYNADFPGNHYRLREAGAQTSQGKLASLKTTLSHWERHRSATKRVLIGQLNHDATVVRPGRCFLRQLIETMKRPRLQSQSARINLKCRAGIKWWSLFIEDWNRIALFPCLPPGSAIISDASGSWGCGAFCTASLNWFQLQWPPHWESTNIAAKELLPIMISAAIWGPTWHGTVVRFKSDNQVVATALTSRSAHDPHLSHLLRCLFFLEAYFQFEHQAQHLAGRLNTAANALLRNRAADYFRIFPKAPAAPTPVADSLRELTMDSNLSWTSPHRKTLFRSILLRESQRVQRPPTLLPSVAI